MEITSQSAWLKAADDHVREFLLNADDEIVDLVLRPSELEALRFGYRERVTDTHLNHIRELPQELPGIFAAVPYCIDLVGGPYLECDEAVCKAFRPKSAQRPRTA